MATIEHARRVYTQGVRQGLVGWHRLADYEASASICNGIGAEWMPRWLRWLVTRLNPSLEATAWIHDLGYVRGGTPGTRLDEDLLFLLNGLRAAREHAWWTWRRYAVALLTAKDFILLRLFGAAAFNFHLDREGGDL